MRDFGHGREQRARKGFALPTILIASTVMLIVMGTALVSVSSTVLVSLESRHYSTYAKNAAQSGMAMAQACLRQNNYEPEWTDATPLRPHTDCSGVPQAGVSEYLHDTSEARSTFIVPAATALSNGVQRISVNATSERLGAVSGEVWRTYTDASYATISAQATFNSVTFGYVGVNGAFFGVVDPMGQVSTVGYNQNGQLGNGTTTNATTPQIYGVPAGTQISQLFSSLLSGGNALFAITTDGRLFGAGSNGAGQLGNNATASTQSTPVQFQLPGGVEPRFVSVGATNTYVIASDNNIYAAGACALGALGTSYTISGCSNRSNPLRVALPAVTSNLNTRPVVSSDWVQATNIVTDANTAYVRMQGGQVWGWGANESGQLGDGTTTNRSSPVQITSLGNSGQPTARQVAFDGKTVWILDSNNEVWATGSNAYGALGAATTLVSGASSSRCLVNTGNATGNGVRFTINTCTTAVDRQFEWDQNGTLKVQPNSSTVKCVENVGNVNAVNNPISTAACNESLPEQQWVMTDTNQIMNPATGKCIETPNTSTGSQVRLQNCSSSSTMRWNFGNKLTPTKVVLPAGRTVQRITTDQYATLFLMDNGTVWGYGFNTSGQLGNGDTRKFNPAITQMILPPGRTAVDVYTAKSGSDNQTEYANTYVILDNGTVWGTGANTFGQLGNTTAPSYVSTPVQMELPAGAIAQTVQTGFGTTVVLTDEGKIYTVGNNANGQLGDGTTTNSNTPRARQYVNTRPVVLY